MINGSVVDMFNQNALITKSMLASYITIKNWDYFKLLIPFVEKALSETALGEINILELQNSINREYGLDIKQKVLVKILLRMSKSKYGNVIKRIKDTKNRFILDKKINTEKFDKEKNKIKASISEVITLLTSYMNETAIFPKYSEEDAKKALSTFLEKYNLETYKDIESLKYIKNEKNNRINYLVGKFITQEHKKNSDIYKEIREIQTGHFAASAIYYFMSNDKDDISKKINGTQFCLDTSILIDVLGLNYEQDSVSTDEMLKLIRNNGGKLYTYDYYVEELQGIITKFRRDNKCRLSLDLDYFRREQVNDVQINLFQTKLEEKLKSCKITIESEPDYSEMISKNKWHIDEALLRNQLKKNVGYKDDVALNNDVKTIRAISFLRGDSFKCMIDNCKYLFVTDNTQIIKTITELYNKERFKKGEISFAMTDIDLTAYLWLSNLETKSDLPEMILLENAYAAIKPSTEVMQEACRMIEEEIKNSSEESSEDARLLRYSYAMREDLAELTQNDPEQIDAMTIQELKRRQKNRTKKEIAKEYSIKYEKKDIELLEREEKVTERENAADQKEQKISSKEKYIEKKSREMSESRAQYNNTMQNNKNDKVQQKIYKADSDKLREIEKNEYQRCSKKATIVSQVMYIFLLFISGAFLIGLCGIAIFVAIKSSYAKTLNEWCIYLIPVLVTILSILAYTKLVIRKCKVIRKKGEAAILNLMIKRSNILTQI